MTSLCAILIFVSTCQLYAQDVPVPIQVLASDTSYGPDGPWQAVTVELGTPSQKLNLFPGSTFETIILEDAICDGQISPCGKGGLFNASESSSIDDTSITYSGHSTGDAVDWTFGAMLNQGSSIYVTDTLSIGSFPHSFLVPSISIRMMLNVSSTYPDGSKYPLQAGQLALGASTTNQSFSVPDGPSINASLAPNYLAKHGDLPSASYGLHIGSAALKLPLSLWLGGYDASRIIGPVSAQPYSADVANNNFIIDLLDIEIGVDHGGSPFSYHSKAGILADSNDSISAIPVIVNPTAPYLYLPNSTCAALATDLPLTYHWAYGLYFWNVSDPKFHTIVTSPTYMSFIFRGSAQNLTIKVPFGLLNLTLGPPLVDEPTQYFPCTTPQNSASYSLGRAFLQAAFIGVDWDQGLGQWFLAQAPGPNTASIPSQKTITDMSLESSDNQWADTWRPLWTPLPDPDNSTRSVNPQSSSSPSAGSPTLGSHTSSGGRKISPGGYAGIGIAVAIVMVGTVALIFFRRATFKKRSGADNNAPVYLPFEESKQQEENRAPVYEAHSGLPLTIAGSSLAHELPSEVRPT